MIQLKRVLRALGVQPAKRQKEVFLQPGEFKIDSKKEQERDELHRAIWAIADELRGAVDGWDFKNYVLGTMFYRYISENLTNYINSGEATAGNTDFDFATETEGDCL